MTEQTYEILKDKGFNFIYRGPVKVKGKGQLVTYYLTGREENKEKKDHLTLPNMVGFWRKDFYNETALSLDSYSVLHII